jgi:hypothetical protein
LTNLPKTSKKLIPLLDLVELDATQTATTPTLFILRFAITAIKESEEFVTSALLALITIFALNVFLSEKKFILNTNSG